MAHVPHDQGPSGSVFVLHDRCDELHHSEHSTHTEHGLTFLVAGTIQLQHGATLKVSPGTLTVMPAGMPHRPLAGTNVEYWLLGFCATCLGLDETQPLMAAFARVRRGALPVITVPETRRPLVLSLFSELQQECQQRRPESPVVIESWVRLILAEALRAMPGSDLPFEADTLVSGALEFIQRRCLDSISLEDVARAVHRTPAHVADTIKKSTGYSVGVWINAGRIAEATARLLHTDDALEAIALHVGWRDVGHFIRQFRKAHGQTPAAWRRAHRQTNEHRPLRGGTS